MQDIEVSLSALSVSTCRLMVSFMLFWLMRRDKNCFSIECMKLHWSIILTEYHVYILTQLGVAIRCIVYLCGPIGPRPTLESSHPPQ